MYKKMTAAAKFKAVLDVSNGIHKKGSRWISMITTFLINS